MAQIYYFCGHEQFEPEILVKHAVLAEQAGFDGIMVSEHFNPWVADVGHAGYAFSTLGAIAQATSRLRLMTGVVTPLFRFHPAIVAQAAATIDRLSQGRFELGIGTGEALNEVALGYPFPAYKERSERMQEAITIMRQLLDGQTLDFTGRYYQTHHARLYSKPIGSVPIYLAAGGPKTASQAAEMAQGMIISVKGVAETQETLLAPVRQQTAAKQLPFHIVTSRWTVYASTDDEAWTALQPWRGLRAPHRSTITDPAELQQEADTLPRADILSKYTLVASAEDYIKAYSPLITDLHADVVVIQTTAAHDQEAVITMLGTSVLPSLSAL